MPQEPRNSAEVYVAFLDVLGFDSLVRHNSHEILKQVYSDALMEGLCLGLSNGNYCISERDGNRYFTNDVDSTPVNSLVVSDSIIIWSNDDASDSFRNIVSVVRGIMAHSCFKGLPLRGAIEVGPVSWNYGQFDSPTFNVQQSVYGLGLCKAYELEKLQEWSGCAVSDAAIARFESMTTGNRAKSQGLEELISQKNLCRFEVPFKERPRLMYAIDWVNHPEVQARSETVRQAFYDHNKLSGQNGLDESSSISKKIENTLCFVRHVFPDADKRGIHAVWAAIGH